MDKNTKNNSTEELKTSKVLSKPRILFGISFIIIGFVMLVSFISYLINWRADQSQAGNMLDKTIKSSNIFGKIGDWLGNIFVFESLGVAAFVVAFLFFVFGTLILKKNYFKPWKTFGHSLFFICWLPIFMGAITKGEGVLSGVYGFQIMDFLNSVIGTFGLWMTIAVSIILYFILEFNLRPSAIKNRVNTLNENAKEKVKSMMPSSSENFESIFSLKNSVSALFKSSSIKKNRVGDLDLLLMYIAISQTSKDQVQEKNVNVKDLLENRIDPKELSDLFKREEIINAKTSVSIINASGVDGVAKKVALMLSNEGYYVISIDSADIQDPIEITVSDKDLLFNRSYLFSVIPQISSQTNLEDIKIVIGRNIVKSF